MSSVMYYKGEAPFLYKINIQTHATNIYINKTINIFIKDVVQLVIVAIIHVPFIPLHFECTND